MLKLWGFSPDKQAMSLKEYSRKRKFEKTPEPRARALKKVNKKGLLTFVIQKHAASREHYDFRLEIDGVLKSWAVPKGPTLLSGDPRLAVHVEDHPFEYGSFEGVIPKGNYGAGTVMIWDFGTYVERSSKGRLDSEAGLRKGLEKGHITFVLTGKKLNGEFALIKIKKKGAPPRGWLLVKKHDAEASRRDVLLENRSAVSGRSMSEIADQAEAKGEIWLPQKGRAKKPVSPLKNEMPHRIRAMEPLFATTPPQEGGWCFEPFGKGFRALAEVKDGAVKLYSKSFLPFENKYPPITKALRELENAAIFDGEIFKQKNEFIYSISDLLFYAGKDLRQTTLKERKKILKSLSLKNPLQVEMGTSAFSDVVPSALGMLVAKRETSIYQSGLSREWLRFRMSARSSDTPPVTHAEKIYFPKDGYTKGDIVRYYSEMAGVILPHLIDRPQSLHRQPDGIRNEGFFHKDMTGFLPKRLQTVRVFSESASKTVNYVCCQDRWSLLYLANLGCIELNPWLSKRQSLENPQFVVIDLDPDGNSFVEVMKVAKVVHKVLESIGAKSYCKTSGATGLHICIPTGGRYSFETAREFAERVCQVVHQKVPKVTSVERNPAKRRGKIYLDFLQNRKGQTLAAPYCVRPRPKAPVSTPLKWSELKPSLKPEHFTVRNIAQRVKRLGDLWQPLLNSSVDIEACMKQLSKKFQIKID